MIWGCFSRSGEIKQHLVPKKNCTADYLNMLNDQRLPSLYLFLHTGMIIFQDEKARINRAQIIKEWLMESETLFFNNHWPPQSPNFNLFLRIFWSVVGEKLGAVWLSHQQHKIYLFFFSFFFARQCIFDFWVSMQSVTFKQVNVTEKLSCLWWK